MHLMHPAAPDAPGAPAFRQRRSVKVAVVVQRYGADINGGAEQHARYVAEHLAKHVQVEVLTTCAHRDYISWKNELPEGREVVNGITVHRFPVAVERDPVEFAKWSDTVFTKPHSLRDELAWLEAEGPTSPGADRAHQGSTKPTTTSSSFSASAITTRSTAAARCRPRRSWCRPPSATARLAWDCIRRCSAAFARSCTTRSKSAR